MTRLLAGAVILAAALDIATYYRLPLLGAGEANPLVAHLGQAAVVAKLILAAGVAWAIMRRVPHFWPVGMIAVGWWGFGAYVNSLGG